MKRESSYLMNPQTKGPHFVLGSTKFHNKQRFSTGVEAYWVMQSFSAMESHHTTQVVKIRRKVGYNGQWIPSKRSRLSIQPWLPCSLSWSPEPGLSPSGWSLRTGLSPGAPGLLWAFLSTWCSSEWCEGASTPLCCSSASLPPLDRRYPQYSSISLLVYQQIVGFIYFWNFWKTLVLSVDAPSVSPSTVWLRRPP